MEKISLILVSVLFVLMLIFVRVMECCFLLETFSRESVPSLNFVELFSRVSIFGEEVVILRKLPLQFSQGWMFFSG